MCSSPVNYDQFIPITSIIGEWVLGVVRMTIITTTILNESETLWKDLGGWVPSRAYRDPPLEGLCSTHQTLLCSLGCTLLHLPDMNTGMRAPLISLVMFSSLSISRCFMKSKEDYDVLRKTMISERNLLCCKVTAKSLGSARKDSAGVS